MTNGFNIHLEDDVVIVTHVGYLQFDQTNKALAGTVEAAQRGRIKRVLIDHRQADTSNYYNYIVRHAEVAPHLGLDESYKLAFLGLPSQVGVLDFIVTVTRNRGWQSQFFVDRDSALAWLRSGD